MPFAANIQLSCNLRVTSTALTIGTNNNGVNVTYPFTFNDGSSANQATKLWSQTVILLGGSFTYDLTSLSGPTGTVSFSKIKGFILTNTNTTDGNRLLVGNASSNVWSAFLSSSTTTIEVPASGTLCMINPLLQGTNPWTVDSTHKNLKIDSGAATITSKLIIWGI